MHHALCVQAFSPANAQIAPPAGGMGKRNQHRSTVGGGGGQRGQAKGQYATATRGALTSGKSGGGGGAQPPWGQEQDPDRACPWPAISKCSIPTPHVSRRRRDVAYLTALPRCPIQCACIRYHSPTPSATTKRLCSPARPLDLRKICMSVSAPVPAKSIAETINSAPENILHTAPATVTSTSLHRRTSVRLLHSSLDLHIDIDAIPPLAWRSAFHQELMNSH